MFGLGFLEFFILGLIAFLVFGPKQFPFIVKDFIRLLNELKHSVSKIKGDIQNIELEIQEKFQKQEKELKTENFLRNEDLTKNKQTSHNPNLKSKKK